jgi:hypothetical protein
MANAVVKSSIDQEQLVEEDKPPDPCPQLAAFSLAAGAVPPFLLIIKKFLSNPRITKGLELFPTHGRQIFPFASLSLSFTFMN